MTEKYSHGIMVDKVMTKNEVLHNTNKRKDRRMRLDTYSEVTRILLFGGDGNKSNYWERICVEDYFYE